MLTQTHPIQIEGLKILSDNLLRSGAFTRHRPLGEGTFNKTYPLTDKYVIQITKINIDKDYEYRAKVANFKFVKFGCMEGLNNDGMGNQDVCRVEIP